MKISFDLPNIQPVVDALNDAYLKVYQKQVREIEHLWRNKITENIIRDTGVDPSLAHVVVDSMFRTFSDNVLVFPPTNLRSGEE